MKKKYIVLCASLSGALIFPLSVLVGFTSKNEPIFAMSNTSPRFDKVSQILQDKCVDCHSPGMTRMPFYANFPVAKSLMADDINTASARFLLTKPHYSGGIDFSPLMLSRLEGAILNDSMPPALYLTMHWTGALSQAEKDELLDWIEAERGRHAWSADSVKERKGEPIQPLPMDNQLNPEKVELGRQLFFEYALSGDRIVNCASCHDLSRGGTDHAKVATGINGQQGPINSPTVFNAVYNFRQFWDGRARNLHEQAAGPVSNPAEMGADWDEVVATLGQDELYRTQFEKLYAKQGLTKDTVIDAIVTYEMTLITANSSFDQYLRGDDGALKRNEMRGYELFKQHCASCHFGPAVGGLSFEKMGVAEDYFMLRGGDLTKVDRGRFNRTQDSVDLHYFKVPTLRNVELTYPYFHDGSVDSLEQAVYIMARVQRGITLKQSDIDDIVAFLKTLTGEYQGKRLARLAAQTDR